MITTRIGIRNLVRSCGFAVAAAVALGATTRAWAAPATPAADSGHREEAKVEFGQGNVAYNLGKYDEAIAHFEKAYGLSRVPEILFNLGQCYRKLWEADKKSELGRRALHYYQALVREAPQSRVRSDADQFVAELEPAVAQAEARERQGLIDSARGAEALRLAQTFLRDGQLPDAASTADRLLHEPDNGRELLAEAYVVRGRTAARLGDALGAEAQFRRALELRPSAELTDAVPAESAAFEAARRTVAPGGLRLVQAPVGEVPAGKPSEIALTVEGDSERMVATLELGYRRGDGGAFVTTRSPYAPIGAPTPAGNATGASAGSAPVATGPRAAALVIPAAALVAGTHVEYWVRALNSQGGALAESGTATLPFRLQVATPAIAAGTWRGRPGVHAVVQALVGVDDRRRSGDRRWRRGLCGHARRRRRAHHLHDADQAMSARIQSTLLFLLLAPLAAPSCNSSPKGIRVDLDMAGFETTAHTLRLTVTADHGGFVANSPSLPDQSVAISYNSADDLVMTFDAGQGFKFTGKISFRLDTGNTHPLTISAVAEAFNASGQRSPRARATASRCPPAAKRSFRSRSALIATEPLSTPRWSILDDRGRWRNHRTVEQRATRDRRDLRVLGSNSGGAVVIGVPGVKSPTMQVAGAVYVIFNGASTVDLGMPPAGDEFHVYGVNDGDQLGAAVGCFDFDHDGADDLVIGAPGAYGANNEPGAGRVYVIHGSSRLKNATINLSQNQADVEWVGTTPQGHLGAQLLAADLQGGSPGEILIAAPGEGTGTVHLVVPTPMLGVPVAPRPLGGTAGHVTFSGIAPSSIAIGDLDGDGSSAGGSDVIFGDPGFLDTNNARVGAVTIFANVDPTGTTAFDAGATGAAGRARRITGMAANDSLGSAVLALNARRKERI